MKKSIAIRLKNNRSLFLGLLIFIPGAYSASAQILGGARSLSSALPETNFSYADPKEYTIADIQVTGSQFYDGTSMINISGLQVGDKIKVPGEAIGAAIRKIMNQGILDEVQIYATKAEEGKIWLTIELKERPRLFSIKYTGIRKGEQEALNEKMKTYKGKIITETLRKNLELTIRKYYQEKGRLNAKTKSTIKTDSMRGNNAILQVTVDKGEKVKVHKIIINGIDESQRSLILRKIKNTKQIRFGRIFKPSKFVPKKWDEDKEKLLAAMNKLGYRDFQLKSDSIGNFNKESINLVLNIEQGRKYYYRSIRFEGNYIYPDSVLHDVLGVKKGDVYNTEELDKKMNSNPGEDLSSVYMDNGYLYYRAEPVETAIEGDSIDLTIRISEGKQATINKVTLNGNTKTSDHVVMREIRTLPGQKFNKSAIIRTVRELSTIGYFNPEKISPNPVPRPDGTVDIEYNVEEKPSDQIELSGGWGGYIGFVGTLGVVFNNFSAKNIFNPKSYHPLPAGDGQKLAVKFQANGAAYQNYSLTFTEPWLGGKKPNSFSISLNSSISYPYQFQSASMGGYGSGYGSSYGSGYGGYGGYGGGYGSGYGSYGGYSVPDSLKSAHFNVTSLTLSLGKRLKWPDDYFSLSHSISFAKYDVDRYYTWAYPQGISTSVTFMTNFSRNSIDNPTFPRSGSSFSLTGSLTPPYSLLGGNKDNLLIEYHKWMMDASWFSPLVGKFILHTRAHLGFLGSYGGKETTRFERFDLGGSGMVQGFSFNRDIVGLRGYKDRVIGPSGSYGNGGVAYNKFVMEVRYPVSLNPSATIFLLGFAEGGNNFASLSEYSPFNLYKAAGFGARIFMPAFGMIGIDYGMGFDKPRPGDTDFGRQAFTFSIGQQLR
ncbi:MAG: outer membrane protein assembly factor BamA [Aquirufa sp.]